MKTLILDNFDSFTYNLYQYLAELGGNPEVFRNNEISVDEIMRRGFTHIVISPGPGTPEKKKDFGICGEVIKKLSGKVPILGVCLGHQGIIHFLGGKVVRAPMPVHGKQSEIKKLHLKNGLPLGAPDIFAGLPQKFSAMRYHSLIGEKKTMPRDLVITAETIKDSLVMAVQHKTFPLYGVQFHPESIGTELGKKILMNFLAVKSKRTEKEAEKLLYDMADGKISEAKMAEILKEMARRGETVDEISGMARGMRKRAVKIPIKETEFILMDTCGTGGSGLPRMNISTTVAFILAAGGIKIAKHGNRAASGRTGSFDLLEALGVNINCGPREVAQAIKKTGIAFIFAPAFHPAMKTIAPVRKKLGIRTIFNILGPLTNPLNPQYHLLGCSSKKMAGILIEAMKKLKYRHALVVCGSDSLDEITLGGSSTVFELKNGPVKEFTFSPRDVGLSEVKDFKEIGGGDAAHNAGLFEALLKGKAPKALEELLLLNAGFGFYTRGTVKNVRDGIAHARKIIASGAAYKKFLDYRNFSHTITR